MFTIIISPASSLTFSAFCATIRNNTIVDLKRMIESLFQNWSSVISIIITIQRSHSRHVQTSLAIIFKLWVCVEHNIVLVSLHKIIENIPALKFASWREICDCRTMFKYGDLMHRRVIQEQSVVEVLVAVKKVWRTDMIDRGEFHGASGAVHIFHCEILRFSWNLNTIIRSMAAEQGWWVGAATLRGWNLFPGRIEDGGNAFTAQVWLLTTKLWWRWLRVGRWQTDGQQPRDGECEGKNVTMLIIHSHTCSHFPPNPLLPIMCAHTHTLLPQNYLLLSSYSLLYSLIQTIKAKLLFYFFFLLKSMVISIICSSSFIIRFHCINIYNIVSC